MIYKIQKDNKPAISSIDEDLNPWWKSFRTSCSELDIKLSTEIFPAGTDARYLREVCKNRIKPFILFIFYIQIGITAFGFSPINNTLILLHDHNEFLNESVFLKGKYKFNQNTSISINLIEGIDILYKIVLNLANLD